jgi:tetraacyldisaccharide 4'-kinase
MPVPVIVVGNVVAGGAGKTPATLALVRHLQHRGWAPGVVSRGYGRRGTGVQILPADPDPMEYGDEPALIRQATAVPVCVGTQRALAAEHLLREVPDVDVIICDDGLQHYALGRDLAVAVFDDRAIGNGWLLPAGLLREPWPPAQPDRFTPDLLLLQATHGQAAPEVPHPQNMPAFCASRHLAREVTWADGRREDIGSLQGVPTYLLAGIARPESFFAMAEAEGIEAAGKIPLQDHVDMTFLTARLRGLRGTIVCTDKDAVKLFPLWRQGALGSHLQVASLSLVLDIDSAFYDLVDQKLHAASKRLRGL